VCNGSDTHPRTRYRTPINLTLAIGSLLTPKSVVCASVSGGRWKSGEAPELGRAGRAGQCEPEFGRCGPASSQCDPALLVGAILLARVGASLRSIGAVRLKPDTTTSGSHRPNSRIAPTELEDRTDRTRGSHRPNSGIAPTELEDRTDRTRGSHRPSSRIAPTELEDRTDRTRGSHRPNSRIAPTELEDRTDRARGSHRPGSRIAPTELEDRTDRTRGSHRQYSGSHRPRHTPCAARTNAADSAARSIGLATCV
jgi:hypothetical protein